MINKLLLKILMKILMKRFYNIIVWSPPNGEYVEVMLFYTSDFHLCQFKEFLKSVQKNDR